MKIFFRRIHLYLSFAAGLVILIACLTGAVLVFEKEAQMALNKSRYFVTPGAQQATLAQLSERVTTAFPGSRVTGIKRYTDARRSVEVSISAPQKEGPKVNAAPPAAGGRRQPGFTVFVNPYTLAILQKYSYQETFFYQVFALHRWLLGTPDSIGKYIVGIATAIFLFIIITGIILWWPKTRQVLQQRLKIKTTGSFKRLNHDLHIVLGFYSAIILFIVAFTGLAWSFEWFNKGIYTVTSSPLQAPPPPQSVLVQNAAPLSLDAALAAAKPKFGAVHFYAISPAKEASDAIVVSALSENALHESATDAVYIDQYSGTVLGTQPFTNRSLGARVRSTFKPVHTGSIWGTPSKIVAFVVCVLGVSFPITGTIMWWNRTRKKRKLKPAHGLTA